MTERGGGVADGAMPTVATLDELTGLTRQRPDMFIRWSHGPDADVAGRSSDELTGSPLPGLSANPLAVERWWGAAAPAMDRAPAARRVLVGIRWRFGARRAGH